MLKEAVASKAAKLLMTCVCPVAGSTALSLGVPQVRDAVYKATQPRQYAKPKTRVRAVEEAAAPVQLAQNEACPPSSPFVLEDLPPSPAPLSPTGDSPPSTPPTDGPPPPLLPPIDGPPPFIPPTPPGTPTDENPGVPEPSTWLQLIIGFGLIGGVARVTYRKNGRQPDTDPQAS